VLLKSAMSLDGKIATRSGDSRWITSPISRLAVHRQLRDRCDAVVTGIGTVLADDPALTTRLRQREGRNPWRVIVDSRCRISPEALVVKESTADGRTIIATTEGSAESDREFLEGCGCQVIVCESNDTGRVSLEDLLVRLGTRGDVIGVLVEGGAELAAAFLYEGHVDRWLNYIAPIVVGSTAAPGPIGGKGANRMPEALPVRRWNVRRSGRDLAVDSRFG
jgi:diaminohydroxyphosphoribosylaminopyrimidine deaminase/5-amino-6-(5-phosphoribosylamino)uracil reductase